MSIVTPYLIQRCKIRSVDTSVRFSQNVELDYMGAAEFEFGIVPQSLRKMAESKDYHLVPVRDILDPDSNEHLYLWCDIPFQDVPQYVAILKKLRANELRLKEASHFDLKNSAWYNERTWKTDFWWDLDNNTMFSFNVNMMKVLPGCLATSLEYMNEQNSGRSK